jgi:hypothetical protein
MNGSHAAALALIGWYLMGPSFAFAGWYLMMPPSHADFFAACDGQFASTFDRVLTFIAEWRARPDDFKVQREKCEQWELWPDPDFQTEPFSQWHQRGEFETLADCQAYRDRPLTEREKAENKIFADPSNHITGELANQSTEAFFQLSRCIATDDPRLAK